MGLLVMTVEPPPPPSQDEYATWLKKVTPPKVEEAPPPEPEKKAEKKKEEKPEEEEVVEERPTKAAPTKARAAAPAGKPAEAARRAEVRKQLSGAGLLASIGAASEEGGLANVFESEAVVGKDLGAALSERGGVRVTGGTRIGKKGALGAGTSADIGEVDVGAGGSAGELGGRQGVVPKAFVKSTEAVLKKGGIDERGVQMALKRRERGIQQCYERSLKANPKLKGKVVIEWGINEQGRVMQIRVVENSLGDPKVGDCIIDIISRIRFPEATKGIVPVRKTFVFESG
jgi:outer membrane biosynthesis protein TonB